LKRLYFLVAIVAVGTTILAILYASSLATRLDPVECRRVAAEENRWEFCGTIPVPVMTILVLGENKTYISDNEDRYDNRIGADCSDIPDCDVLTNSRAVSPADPISIPLNSDIMFIAEGKFRPNMTIKIQGFSPLPSNTTDANGGSIVSIENITDKSFTLKEHQPASYLALHDPPTSTSFRYSMNNYQTAISF